MEGKLRIAQTDGSEREIGDEKIRMVNGSRQAMPKKKKKSDCCSATRKVKPPEGDAREMAKFLSP